MATRKFRIKIEGKVFEAEVEEIGEKQKTETEKKNEQRQNVQQKTQPPPSQTVTSGSNITAPMPGKVIKVMVSKGDNIKPGSVVLILEAMKMEQEIKSHVEGTVKDIPAKEGETVKKEQTLIIME